MFIDRNEVLALREEGLSMYDISDRIARQNGLDVNDPKYNKMVEQIMVMDGGVYDILFPKPADGYDLDGMKNLASAVLESAVESYGCAIASSNGYDRSPLEKFFTSGMCDVYLGVFDVEMTGADVMEAVKQQAKAGRWGKAKVTE